MVKYYYPACFYKEDNGQYSVLFPDFNNATYGNDLQDALEMAEDFLRSIIVMALRDGEELPAPSDITKVKADEYPDGFVSLVTADMSKVKSTKAVRRTVSIPEWLDEAAAEKNLSLSKILQDALVRQIDS